MSKSVLEVFYYWEKTTPANIFLRQAIHGVWKTWTYREAGYEIRKIASALTSLHLPPESNVAILSKNCAHWIMADIAIWMSGHVSLPIYPSLSASSIRQILEHSQTKVLFVGKLDNFPNQRPAIAKGIQCISFTLYGEQEGMQWDQLLSSNETLMRNVIPQGDKLATIKYTSGTTGTPKGAMFTFAALHETMACLEQFDFAPGKQQRFFSYLPLAHVGERMLVELGAIYSGSTISFPESLETFSKNLAEVKPTVFFAVPRILIKFRETIETKIPNLDQLISIPVVGTIIKRIIRKRLGLSQAQWIFTGAAPVPATLLAWFAKLGLQIREVYGMTENLAYSHINLKSVKFGTVGKPWNNVEARLSKEGEIQVRHKGLMLGYFRERELTAQAFTEDGFLRSGDKGEIDGDGFWKIIGRLKDQFKTEKGKFVDPVPIETKILSNSDVELVCVVGPGIQQPLALVILTSTARKKSREQLVKDISALLKEINANVESFEQLKAVVVLKDDWTIDNGLLTPTLKVKRHAVEKSYSSKYLEWSESREIVITE